MSRPIVSKERKERRRVVSFVCNKLFGTVESRRDDPPYQRLAKAVLEQAVLDWAMGKDSEKAGAGCFLKYDDKSLELWADIADVSIDYLRELLARTGFELGIINPSRLEPDYEAV